VDPIQSELSALRRRVRLLSILTVGGLGALVLALGGADLVAATAVRALVAGGVLFEGAGGAATQDSANFFWDDTNNRLGLGTATPSSRLDVNGTSRFRSTVSFGSSGQEAQVRWLANVGNGEPGALFQGKAGRAAGLGANGTIAGVLVSTTGDVTVNESGLAADFRVESDADANALFVSGLANAVGIGTDTPAAKLDVNGSLALRGTNPPALTAKYTHDYPTGAGSWLRLSQTYSSGDPARITGFTGGSEGRILIVTNVGSWGIGISPEIENTGSQPQNRITGPASLTDYYALQPTQSMIFAYDGTLQRWRQVK
jgi:hypothetical protein